MFNKSITINLLAGSNDEPLHLRQPHVPRGHLQTHHSARLRQSQGHTSRFHQEKRITPLQGFSVEGVVYFGLAQEDMSILNAFENVEYVPTIVTVNTQEGPVEAVAYIYADPSNLLQQLWDLEQFQRNHKEQFAKKHVEGEK